MCWGRSQWYNIIFTYQIHRKQRQLNPPSDLSSRDHCDIMLENRKSLDNFDDQNDWSQCIVLTNVFSISFELGVLNFVIRYDKIPSRRFRCTRFKMANLTKPRREIQFFYRHLEPQFSSSQIIVCNIWNSNFSHIFSNIHVIYKGNFTLKGPTASKSVLLFFIFYDVTVLSTITPFYCSEDVFALIIKKTNPFLNQD